MPGDDVPGGPRLPARLGSPCCRDKPLLHSLGADAPPLVPTPAPRPTGIAQSLLRGCPEAAQRLPRVCPESAQRLTKACRSNPKRRQRRSPRCGKPRRATQGESADPSIVVQPNARAHAPRQRLGSVPRAARVLWARQNHQLSHAASSCQATVRVARTTASRLAQTSLLATARRPHSAWWVPSNLCAQALDVLYLVMRGP